MVGGDVQFIARKKSNFEGMAGITDYEGIRIK